MPVSLRLGPTFVSAFVTSDGAPRYWIQAVIGGAFLAGVLDVVIRLS